MSFQHKNDGRMNFIDINFLDSKHNIANNRLNFEQRISMSHGSARSDEESRSEQEPGEVSVGQPGGGAGPDLQHVVLVQLQDVSPAGGEQPLPDGVFTWRQL